MGEGRGIQKKLEGEGVVHMSFFFFFFFVSTSTMDTNMFGME